MLVVERVVVEESVLLELVVVVVVVVVVVDVDCSCCCFVVVVVQVVVLVGEAVAGQQREHSVVAGYVKVKLQVGPQLFFWR